MSDDLDDLLRRTMKTLDDQVPSGYFEGLPNRTLARLGEESSMQTSTENSSGTAVPPQDRDEDSGLHDIRSMASSTKMRISSRRITQPPAIDEDILASSSAGWKAVALPEPARMVSLPEIESLPAASEKSEKSDRKSKKELKAERISAKQIATTAVVETAPAAPLAAAKVSEPAADVAVTPIIGARFAQPKKSKGGLYALIGTGLAAAAGVGWYVSTQMGAAKEAAPEQVSMSAPAVSETKREQVEGAPAAGSAAVTAEPIAAPPAEEKPAEPAVVATGMDQSKEDTAGGADGAADKAAAKPTAKGAGKKKSDPKVVIDLDSGPKRPEQAKDTKEKPAAEPVKKEGEGEPSFDALLKEAGVQEKKPQKVVLEKKSLSGSDIKTGMNGVAGKAQACYAGQQGTAAVKLTVAPDGTVSKVNVTGVFAGTPVGACVEKAVKGAKFPAWDGGPQSFGFSYLLAE